MAGTKVLSLPNAFGKYRRSEKPLYRKPKGEGRAGTRGPEAQQVAWAVTERGVLFLKKQEEHNVITNISHEKKAPLVTKQPWQQVEEHTPKCRAEHMRLSAAEEFRCPHPFREESLTEGDILYWHSHSSLLATP